MIKEKKLFKEKVKTILKRCLKQIKNLR